MSFKYIKNFLLLTPIYFSPGLSAAERGPPIFHFEKDDRLITIIGSPHCAPLSAFLPRAQELVSEYSSLLVEHMIGNMALDFLKEISEDEVKGPREENLKNRNITGLDRFLKILPISSPALIESFDLESDKKNEVPFDFQSLLDLKPWVADLILSSQNTLRLMDETGGVELAMARLFIKENKRIDYLETTKEVFDILDKEAEFKENEFLKLLIVSTSTHDFDFYRKNTQSSPMPEKSKFISNRTRHPKSVLSRNELWLLKIVALAESTLPEHEKCLIIVGYGHLQGKNGLIARLKNGDLLKDWRYFD